MYAQKKNRKKTTGDSIFTLWHGSRRSWYLLLSMKMRVTRFVTIGGGRGVVVPPEGGGGWGALASVENYLATHAYNARASARAHTHTHTLT